MVEHAAERALAIAEVWEVLADAVDPVDLPELRLVCRKANEAAARRAFHSFKFKISRNSYAPARLRSIRSLAHVRHLQLDCPSLMNLKRLLGVMTVLMGGPCEERIHVVDLKLSASQFPALLEASKLYPVLRRRLRSLWIVGQGISDYRSWNGSDAVQWWEAVADFLSLGAASAGVDAAASLGAVPLRYLLISPDTGLNGILWPDQITNGPRVRFYGALRDIVAPHLEFLAVKIGRTEPQPTEKGNANPFFALSRITWPKLRRLYLAVINTHFTEFERQDFDVLLRGSPELEELDLTVSMTYPLRLRTYLPKLRHLKLQMVPEADQLEHSDASRDEVVAFIQQHCGQLVSLSLEVQKHSTGFMLFWPGNQQQDAPRLPSWEPIDIDLAAFPRLRAISGHFHCLNPSRAAPWSVKINAGPHEDRAQAAQREAQLSEESAEQGQAAWSQAFAEERRRTSFSAVTDLQLECCEPRQIEHGLAHLVDLVKEGHVNGAQLRELHLTQSPPRHNMYQRQTDPDGVDRQQIWKWLRRIAVALDRLEVLSLPLSYYESGTYIGRCEREAHFGHGDNVDAGVPRRLRFIVEGDTWYRVVRTRAWPAPDEGMSGGGATMVRLEEINPRHLALAHPADVLPTLRIEDFCAGLNKHPPLPRSFPSLMEHLDVADPVLRYR
ncbi:hypothetical protein OC844_001402 [Tilletia horrida]|nr:hypothetical protein OC844_001402 [Tilletia horrida]